MAMPPPSQVCVCVCVCVCYQSLALHQSDLGPEVRDGHGDGFPIKAVRGIPY